MNMQCCDGNAPMPKVHLVTVSDDSVKLVDANLNRKKLHIVTSTVGGVLIGFDEAMTRDHDCFLVPANQPLEIEHFRGCVYARNVTAGSPCTVYYFDE